MIQSGLVARVIKTATMGLDRRHIGKTLNELQPYLLKIATLYGCNPCGEGGEYETFTVDCPLFQYRIELLGLLELMSCSDDVEIVTHSESMDAPVLLLVPKAWHLEKKEKDNDNDDKNNQILSAHEEIDGYVDDKYNTNEKHKKETITEEDILFDDSEDREEDLEPRPPVVVVM